MFMYMHELHYPIYLYNKQCYHSFLDVIRDVHDPEKPENLEELNVVSEDCVSVSRLATGQTLIRVEFSPTVPHCSLASLIGN